MLTSVHLLTGAAIAVHVPEAVPAAMAAVTSHFVLDAVPHKDYIGLPAPTKANWLFKIIDAAVGVGLVWLLVPVDLRWYAFFIALWAVSPDLISIPKYFWLLWRKHPWLSRFHHWHGEVLQYRREWVLPKESWMEWVMGMLPQVVVLVVAVYFLNR